LGPDLLIFFESSLKPLHRILSSVMFDLNRFLPHDLVLRYDYGLRQFHCSTCGEEEYWCGWQSGWKKAPSIEILSLPDPWPVLIAGLQRKWEVGTPKHGLLHLLRVW
jgi:hypothetical protein